MRLLQVEAWTLDLVEQVRAGRVPEDARVELKAAWPVDHAKAARRVAGHANAALGEPVLWVIGLDEARGAVGTSATDTAAWLAGVMAHFDGVTPSVRDLVVRAGDASLVALLFDTTRAPFVVRNPAFGATPSPISHEVPWRDGTRVRSARREDLVRLLAGALPLPSVEVLGAEVHARPVEGEHDDANVTVRLDLYCVPPAGETVVLPFHRSVVRLRDGVAGGETVPLPVTGAYAASRYIRLPGYGDRGPVSHTVHSADNEVLLEGPGRVSFRANGRVAAIPEFGGAIAMEASLAMAGSDRALTIDVQVPEAANGESISLDGGRPAGAKRSWVYRRPAAY